MPNTSILLRLHIFRMLQTGNCNLDALVPNLHKSNYCKMQVFMIYIKFRKYQLPYREYCYYHDGYDWGINCPSFLTPPSRTHSCGIGPLPRPCDLISQTITLRSLTVPRTLGPLLKVLQVHNGVAKRRRIKERNRRNMTENFPQINFRPQTSDKGS